MNIAEQKRLDYVLKHFDQVRGTGGKYKGVCPSCEGSKLSIQLRSTGVCIKCFNGCKLRAVLDTVGLRLSELNKPINKEGRTWSETRREIDHGNRKEIFLDKTKNRLPNK